ncbi:unnamed protein product [Oikopleura dioica]|uniref:Uncharacterized protein n=1 Tax=Oikopleura dioica TaxID=34765 RepID=E4XL10_OIKDI|nr:unnamed protein product [Oikopleura dioica]
MHTKLGDRWNSIDPENIIQVPLNFEQESKLVTKALGILQQRKREGILNFVDFRVTAIREFYLETWPRLYHFFEATTWDNCQTSESDVTFLIQDFIQKGYIKDMFKKKKRQSQTRKLAKKRQASAIPTIDLTELSDTEACSEPRQKDAFNQWEENPEGKIIILPKRKKIEKTCQAVKENKEEEITILENNEES